MFQPGEHATGSLFRIGSSTDEGGSLFWGSYGEIKETYKMESKNGNGGVFLNFFAKGGNRGLKRRNSIGGRLASGRVDSPHQLRINQV